MGKATRWFKGLFGKRKNHERSCVCDNDSDNGTDCSPPMDSVLLRSCLGDTEKEQNKHAFVVANATSSTAEAEVSAAKAAVEVVRLNTKGSLGDVNITTEERWAAVKIQKVFRGSLARKALRALKGIVKLQALVRGFLVRKRAAAMLQSIQALIRVQTAMRSKRIHRCLNKEYNNMFQPRQFLDKFDETSCDERSPRIVEIEDTYMRRSSSRSKSRQVHNVVTMSEYEDDYKGNGLELSFNGEKWKFATAQNTPRFSSSSYHNAAKNRYYVTQCSTKSVCGNGLYDYGRSVSSPGYMEKTQSFKAKVRSHSAPRQRFERKRLSLDEVMASRNSVVSMLQQQPQRYSCS